MPVIKNNTAMIERHPNEVILYYNGQKHFDKTILAYCMSHFDHVRSQDVHIGAPTATRLAEIALLAKMPVRRLVDPEVDGEDHLPGTDQELLKMLHYRPELIATPILVRHDHAIFVNSKADLSHEITESARSGVH
jgi:hypothetical protein